VYLHLDRPNYIQGDTIWFKAYSWFGFDQVADTTSGVLYVDLLNPDGGVLQKRKLLIHNGTSHGDFTLGKDITPGSYILRAYTRWMQNMNTGDPFYKNVMVNQINRNFHVECNPVIIKQSGNDSLRISFRFFEMDQRGELVKPDNHRINYSLKIGDQLLHSGNVTAENTKEEVFKWSLPGSNLKDSVAVFEISIKDDRLTYEKQFQIPFNEPVDIQFFPEGGSMVAGIRSKVAFKAIGKDGLSREVSGVIKDDNGEVITTFKSIHKGMGEFMLKPETGKEYSANLLFNKRLFIIPLPHALIDGCVMSVSNRRDSNNLQLTIKRTHSIAETQKYLAGTAYGKVNFALPFEITGDSCLLKIPLDLFPEGLSGVTIMNKEFIPECERLVYIDKYERFKIEVKPDSFSYGTRSKVTLQIKATGSGGKPVLSDLSLAVVDKDQIIKDEVASICAYKLLKSELHGNIEDADFYFRNDSCIDQRAVDLLMLTQGYRKFLPAGKKIAEQKLQPERNFEISGIIKLPGKGVRVKKYDYSNIRLTLLCRSEGMYLDQSSSFAQTQNF
jgi:hypothetical protein